MKFRNKMLCVFAAITVLATGGITVHAALEQRLQHIQNELAGQMQTIRLLNNSILGQYFAYINQQIISVLSTRAELREQTQILTHYVENYATNDADLIAFLQGQQDSFNQVGKDLMLLKDNEILIAPKSSSVLQGRSMGGKTLLSSVRADYNQLVDGYYLMLFSPERKKDNFLSFSHVIGANDNYVICVLQNIDNLIAYYSADSQSILPQLNETFEELQNNLSGTAAIINAQDGNLILATADDAKQTLAKLDLKALFKPEALNKNVELTSQSGEKFFACASYFKPLDWYILIYRDEQSVIAPALTQAKTSLLIGLAVLALAVLLAFLMSGRLTSSLNLIAQKADEIARVNLSDPKAIAAATSSLAGKGNDEVASVGRALALMGRSISDNLQKLIAANQQKDRMQGELKAASAIQEGMLPQSSELPQSSFFSCDAFLLPAKEVGGDLYDVQRLNDEELAIIIGDVSDKGVPAALFMSTTLSLARCALGLGFSPQKTMELINNRLSERNPNMMFVTMYIMVLNEKTGQYKACNAGHCYPIIIGRDGLQELDTISGPAVGPLSGMEYAEYAGVLNINETLLLYTDGVSEAQNDKREFFGTERILQVLEKRYGRPCEETLQAVVDAVASFRGDYQQTDDITLVCCQRR
ncbi:MAG: SpoIIE family protein phosphatase [Candidatus Anaerobiospirillum merdipullorum]|uniref:SpoIIE family protein phosphatase n=1 Tax=Candidatus Anaerobiospirillum merdipullorum TaxID=2838450 RepID=A0A9E2KN91_9GAMM|nr:SpoIIE family protein phosphatase [Candidatus Anaerobiospirillum merdipullorum]